VHVRFLQFSDVQERPTVLAQLPAELPGQRLLSLLLLRAAERASPNHVHLDTAAAVRYSVTLASRVSITRSITAAVRSNYTAAAALDILRRTCVKINK